MQENQNIQNKSEDNQEMDFDKHVGEMDRDILKGDNSAKPAVAESQSTEAMQNDNQNQDKSEPEFQFMKEQGKSKAESGQMVTPSAGASTANALGEVRTIAPIPEAPKKIVNEAEDEKPVKRIWGQIFSGWILAIGFLGIVILLILFLLAKSGMLNIPYISDWVYEAPRPQRFVIANDLSWDQFRNILTQRVQEQNIDSEPPLSLTLDEKELTGLLTGSVDQALRSEDLDAPVAQIAVLPDSVELYFFLTWKDFFTFEILTYLVPIVEDDGTLKFEVKDARIGDLPIPGQWVLQLVGYFFKRDIGVWKIILSNGYGIQDVQLFDGSLDLLIGPVESR